MGEFAEVEASLREAIQDLRGIVGRLETQYPSRHFTIDGHLLGSIGEVYAEKRYGLELLKASYPVHDAETKDGRFVQIKVTQGKSAALRKKPADYLIVLFIDDEGGFNEVYNGPGGPVWAPYEGRDSSNGQFQVSLTRLRELNEDVAESERITRDSKGADNAQSHL